MSDNNPNNLLCPSCHRVNSLKVVNNLKFCTACTYCNRNKSSSFTRTTVLDYHAVKLLQELGINECSGPDAYDSAFAAGVLGYSELRKRLPELLVPVYRCRNYASSNIRISKTKIKYPSTTGSVLSAGLLSNTYYPERLLITDNALQGLKVRLVSATLFSSPIAVLIALGKTPPLEALVQPEIIVATADPALISRLPSDAVVLDNGLRYKQGQLAMYLRSLFCR